MASVHISAQHVVSPNSASKTHHPALHANASSASSLSSSFDLLDEIKPNLSFGGLVKKSLKQSLDLFAGNAGLKPADIEECTKKRLKMKILGEYSSLCDTSLLNQDEEKSNNSKSFYKKLITTNVNDVNEHVMDNNNFKNINYMQNTHSLSKLIQSITNKSTTAVVSPLQNDKEISKTSIVLKDDNNVHALSHLNVENNANTKVISSSALQLSIKAPPKIPRPEWHRPWKLHRVISGHQGWVQCLAVDPTNEWFVTGGNDRLIKIWDMASGRLRLSLTGHVNAIRGLAVSERHPYMFSCAEDNRVKCWDLEQNKVVRDYHGHLSGVYCLALHPSLDILATGGRDSVVRVWDIRTKNAIHVLSGHEGTVMTINMQNALPQLISGSQDKMVRLWDLRVGRCNVVLTNHKKSVRAMAIHPHEYTFCSCAADNIKVWTCPSGVFDRNISGHNAIINCCAIKSNSANSSIIVAGTNNGNLVFWDWRSGYKYDTITSKVQPGSLESENGIFTCAFDKSETRLITGECDKTIKIWKEDEDSTPTTHPINWVPPREFKRY